MTAGALPLQKCRGGFHIRRCPLAVRQTSAGAYRMRPYGFRFRQREKTPRGAPSSLGPLCEGAPPAGGGGEKRAAGRNISGLDCQKTFVGASIARPCPLAVRQTYAGAYRMRPYGSRFRHRPCRFWAIQQKRVCDILDVTDSWCAVQDSNL